MPDFNPSPEQYDTPILPAEMPNSGPHDYHHKPAVCPNRVTGPGVSSGNVARSLRESVFLDDDLPDETPDVTEAPAEHTSPFYTSGREVPIDPAGRVKWAAHETGGGTLYVPKGTKQNTAELLKKPADGELIDAGGSGGRIYLPKDHRGMPDVVVKEFGCKLIPPSMAGLPALRANVMLADGLDVVKQTGSWRIRGVRILGAFVLDHPRQDPYGLGPECDIPLARWAMEHIIPDENVKTEHYMPQDRCGWGRNGPWVRPSEALPSERERHELYDRALKTAAGSRWVDANYDDGAENMIIESTPRFGPWPLSRLLQPGSAVKIDIIPRNGLYF